MTYWDLNLDVSYETSTGDCNSYSNNGYNYLNPITQEWCTNADSPPTGRVWVSSSDNNPPWTPVASSNPSSQSDGNPAAVTPTLQDGDIVRIAVRDTTPNPTLNISSVQFAVVFGRTSDATQAPLASPFRDPTTLNDDTTFTGTTVVGSENNYSGWFTYPVPTVNYPNGGTGDKCFTFYIGLVVTYKDSSGTSYERQFGVDPEMQVSDYQGN